MKVIIAEKPSLGRTIADALLQNKTSKDGYISGHGIDGHILVTWGFGHLMQLNDVEDYPENIGKNKWSDVALPFCPNPFVFTFKKDPKTKKADSGVKKQFQIISKLINDPSCDEIIHAGDADREGEVIVRLILEKGLKNRNARITRLWLPSLTPQTIVSQYKVRKVDSEYNSLYNEGLARVYIDWLLGINLTRSFTLRTSELLSVGRVICPIVLAIYEREQEIKNFQPVPYLGLESKVPFPLKSAKKFEMNQKQEALLTQNAYNGAYATVSSIQKKTAEVRPPKLFSLSSLQGLCGKKYKLKPSDTLKYVQSLYERGFVTYPRTNTEYLAEDEKEKVRVLLSVHGKMKTEFKDTKRVFDNSKIESHSAIIPTTKIANGLQGQELLVYETILHRFLAVFWKEPCKQDVTEMTMHVGNDSYSEEIKVKGISYLSKGWKEIEEEKTEDTVLPIMQQGDHFPVQFELIQKETQPPKRYTVDALNKYLRNPFSKEKETIDGEFDDTEDYKQILKGCEIGTEATRAGIIDNAIRYQYISLKKNVYSLEPKGEFLVKIIRSSNLDMSVNRTVSMQILLKKIYHNEATIHDSVYDAMKFLHQYFDESTSKENATFQNTQDIIGCCPWCGQPLIKIIGKTGPLYVHKDKNPDCSFLLSNQIMIYGQKVKVTDASIKKLLNGKSIKVKLMSKKNTPYEVLVKIKTEPTFYNGKQYVGYDVSFANKH